MAPASTRLWLFRPCEHAWDAAQRLRGSTNLPATPDSLAELRQRVARLAVGPDVVYHPGDDASAETAHGIATRFACALRADPDLSDPDLGLLEGLSMAEFERRFESRSLEWAESPLTVEPPEGEPLADARLRILAAFAAVLRRHEGERVGLVLHRAAMAMVRDALACGDGSRLWERTEGRHWCTECILPPGADALLGG
jgi:broad specificity phosphatase PhoE